MDWSPSSSDCTKLHHGGEDGREHGEYHGPVLLMISSNTEEDTWNFYNIAEDRVLDMQVSLPNKRYCGCSKGWLILVEEDYAVTLLNPFSRIKGKQEKENSIIRLPPLIPIIPLRVEKRDYYVHKAMISGDPILNPKECIIVVINDELSQMAFLRLKDKRWLHLDEGWTAIEEIVNVEDKFYAVNNFSQLLSINLTKFSNSEDATVAATGIVRDYALRSYLVDSEDGLLMVRRISEWDVDKCVTKKFKIFQLNGSKNGWIEKNTLGEYALFVGDNSTISILASKLKNCKPNCIYFNQDDNRIKNEIGPHGPYDFGVYNVESQEISKPYTVDAMTLLKMTKRPPIWITPPPSL
ncbi:PREDICTED: F-box protein SKIP23-like [Fragaria vesca subsp. vesca]|uniref:F-box protein SKIP23-like n=1 Tax=Fragaria vesca subsp. vesca TaxID=101020 RepID=UPI0002C3716E|nr:PREDICTED: F-box protein SKIP23-like [Fragaria vesca subsp. vesca]